MRETLVDNGAQPNELPYQVRFLPIRYSLGGKPQNPLQRKILAGITECLQSPEFQGEQLPLPTKDTPADQTPRMVIVFGNGQLLSDTNSIDIHKGSPRPAPEFLMVNTADRLPVDNRRPVATNRFEARKQTVEALTQCALIVAADGKSALWVSPQGNHYKYRGTFEKICQEAAFRMQVHFYSPMVNKRHDGGLILPWETWAQAPVHERMSVNAHALGEHGIIEDKVYIERYTGNKRKARLIEMTLNANSKNGDESGVGESMRSGDGPEGIMAVTRTGGGKVNLDKDPKKGHLTPIWAITPDGYVIPTVTDMPEGLSFGNGSREAQENAMARLFIQLLRENIVDSLKGFHRWLQKGFIAKRFLAFHLIGLALVRLHIDHAHWLVDSVSGNDIEVEEPDYTILPKIDYSCGTIHSEWSLMSGLAKVKALRAQAGLRGKKVFINMPGHGYVGLAEDPEDLAETIIYRIKRRVPEPV